MTQRSVRTQWTAAVLVVSLIGVCAPAGAAGTEGATVRGAVFSAETESPVVGARVHVGDPRTGAVHTSETTAADGGFAVDGLAPGSYEISVELNGGLYLVATPLQIDGSQDRSMTLSIREVALDDQANGIDPRIRARAGLFDSALGAALTMAGIAIVAAWGIKEWTERDESPSPSTNQQ